jgi:hypothetical protein
MRASGEQDRGFVTQRRMRDRRKTLGRRIVRDRRRESVPVAVERRSGEDRRRWPRRSGEERRGSGAQVERAERGERGERGERQRTTLPRLHLI